MIQRESIQSFTWGNSAYGWHKTPAAVDSTVSSTSRVRLQILIRPPPQSPWRPKRKKKKVGEGSVSLTFIMIKEKPVYPYNTLSLKHRVPPHRHRRTFFLQPISHREPHLHRAQPQRGGARGERRCQEQLTPPSHPPQRASNFVLSFSLFTGRFHQGLLRQAVTLQGFFSISLRDAPCDRSAVWMRPKCDEAKSLWKWLMNHTADVTECPSVSV